VIVLDTNVLSELIKPAPAPQVLRWVDDQYTAELVIAAINAAELRAGVAQRRHRGDRSTSRATHECARCPHRSDLPTT
jgi:toxin FitB